MNLFRLIAEFFLVYILYKLIFDFVIPIYQSAGKMKRQFGEMQNRMQQDMKAASTRQQAMRPEPVKKEGDYIDFEEIK
ncbi:MAG TPA: hypothetical protein VG847_08475 [Chitinophagaceae bacterium]|nr:hypothetical protein [Chitinophagaceae bacterium]